MYWTTRLAVLLLAAALWLRLTRRSSAAARALWTFGCVLFLAHVALAFHQVHHWSHTAAYEHTANQTAALLGPRARTGAGLYLNYLFMLIWAADVAWWWLVGLQRYNRRRSWITALIYGFMAFMAFNATVIFAHGAGTRLTGAVLTALLLISLARRLSKSVDSPMPPEAHPT
jgi:hypothetical protein